jgi:glycosyltransferase involved in cell wall biosynthesis
METIKPEIVFTFPAVLGGVSSFNFNIINYSKLIGKFYSKVILLKEESDKRPLFTEKFNVDEQLVFEYSDKENQYHLQKRLNKLLGDSDGAIITDNGLTMEAAARFKNPKTVFSLIHDYYYVNQNVRLGNLADVAIAHSSFFSDAVFAANPSAFASRSFYIPYGIKQLQSIPPKKSNILNLVFLGRLEHEKGVLRLFEIEQGLQEKKILVNWTIIGKGSLKKDLEQQWKSKTNIFFAEPNSTDEVYNLLSKQDVFVFPTIFEGTPVSILECLANGVVPIVNDLPGGIRDIVNEQIGFRCSVNDMKGFVENITTLNCNRDLLTEMQQNCFALAQEKYDVKLNADKYVSFFLKFNALKRLEQKVVRN